MSGGQKSGARAYNAKVAPLNGLSDEFALIRDQL